MLAHHRAAGDVPAGYIYLMMAGFGTLMLLFAFGLLAGHAGTYEFGMTRVSAPGPDFASFEHVAGLLAEMFARVTSIPLSRTPRPPVWLTAPSPISSIPTASSAPTSFIKKSTLPRITSALASIRWIVGTERPDSSASLR